MAIFRPGGVVGSVSGKLGGTVFARAGGAAVIRARPQRARIASESATGERAALARCQQVWAASSEDVRAAWDAFARSKTFPNRLGEGRNITGRALFLKWAMSVAAGSPSVDTAPPTFGYLWSPQFFQVYYLEGGPVAVTAWGSPLGNANLQEQLFFQRGRGVLQTRGFKRLRRVYADGRDIATEDRYTDLEAAGFDLLTDERFAAGLSWYYDVGFMGARAECYGTVGDVPWPIDPFLWGVNPPYAGSPEYFTAQSAVVKDGPFALNCSLPSGASLFPNMYSIGGLPLYPVAGHQFECWVRADSGTSVIQVRFGFQESGTLYYVRWGSAENVRLFKQVSFSNTLLATAVTGGWSVDTWYRIVVDWGASGSIQVSLYTAAGALVASDTGTDSTFDSGGVGFAVSNSGTLAAEAYFDGFEVTGASAV